jgi:hypothetical protein
LATSQSARADSQIAQKAVTTQWQDGKQVILWPDEVAAGKPRFRRLRGVGGRLRANDTGDPRHLGLGQLYRRTGKREHAQEHLTISTAMYREMGMTYWLEKAEAELG